MIDLNYDTEIFNFNNNKLTHLSAFTPSWGGGYYLVKEFYFNNNEIVFIDSAAFDHFDELEILQLSNNKIVSLPFDHIFDISKLSVLNSILLDNYCLKSIQDETARFPRGVQMVMDLKGKTISPGADLLKGHYFTFLFTHKKAYIARLQMLSTVLATIFHVYNYYPQMLMKTS